MTDTGTLVLVFGVLFTAILISLAIGAFTLAAVKMRSGTN